MATRKTTRKASSRKSTRTRKATTRKATTRRASSRKASSSKSWSAKKTAGSSYRRASATGRGTVKVKAWTKAEISKLRSCYRNTTNTAIAKSFGRTVASVRAKAGALNLKKNKNFLSMVAKTAGTGGWGKSSKSWSKKASSSRKTTARRKPATRRASAKKNSRRR